MLFLLSDSELVCAIHCAKRLDNGLLQVEIPAGCLDEQARDRLVLTFDSRSSTVASGAHSTRLSPVQFSLLRYIHDHGTSGFEDIQDEVWDSGEVSDNSIRATCSRVNARLLEAGFRVELVASRGRVSLVKLD